MRLDQQILLRSPP